MILSPRMTVLFILVSLAPILASAQSAGQNPTSPAASHAPESTEDQRQEYGVSVDYEPAIHKHAR